MTAFVPNPADPPHWREAAPTDKIGDCGGVELDRDDFTRFNKVLMP